jgi:tetratricopeptide (TPR) repeat protein
MKKTLTEQYVENLLSEASENELLDAQFERERLKMTFKKRLQHTRRKQQYRLVGSILVAIIAIAGGTGTYYYYQNTKRNIEPQKVLVPSSELVAALIQKTTVPSLKPVISNVLMGDSIQISVPDKAKNAFKNNDFATAAQSLSTLSPLKGDLLYYLGFCYMHTNEHAKAIDYLAKAIPTGCNPNFKDDIDWWTALLLAKQGEWVAAKAIIEKLPANHYARKNKDVEILLSQINHK